MRVLDCHDFVASEARYHIACIERFSFNKDQKSSYATTVGQILRNIDILCKWLEPDAETYSIFEIYSKMIAPGGKNDDVYTKRWLKTKLKMKYGERIIFSEAFVKLNVVCFMNVTEFIVNDKWFP